MSGADTPVQIGQELLGKYVVKRVLGQGGMGVVVEAAHIALGHRVAIKFLLPEACNHPGAVERFLREARAAVQIQSEHVARVSDIGKLDTGLPYMVMEFLDGNDLSEEIQARGVLPVDEAVKYLLEALEAIAEAHALNIVHRDLKPANLFLAKRKDGTRTIKVLDFGISKAVQSGELNLTQTSSMMGSPLYMAPEQIRNSKTVDARADVWSLGVILHECLSGRTPFGGTTLSGVLAAIVADAPEPLENIRHDLPPMLISAVARCLEKDPARRVQNVADLAQLVSTFAPAQAQRSLPRIAAVLGKTLPQGSEAGVHDLAATAAVASPPITDTGHTPKRVAQNSATAQTWAHTGSVPRPPRSSRATVVIAAAVLVALAGGLWFTLYNSDTATPGSAASADLEAASAPSAATPPVATPPVAAPSVAVAPSSAPAPTHAVAAENAPEESAEVSSPAPKRVAPQPAKSSTPRPKAVAKPSATPAVSPSPTPKPTTSAPAANPLDGRR